MTVTITPNQLAEVFGAEARRLQTGMRKASHAAARRLVTYLANRADELEITDRGGYKRGFRALANQVFNDWPIAGIIELGARPHPVSEEGREAIAAWAMRKLGLDAKAAKSLAFVVSQDIAENGQEPRYVVRDSLPEARRFFAEELVRIMNASRRQS